MEKRPGIWMGSSVLLLNAGYEPLHIVSWKRAFVLMFQEKVEVLEKYEWFVSTVQSRYHIPAVIRLKTWINLKRRAPVIRFSRLNLYARDDFRCQYCAQRFPERKLTLDHVVPVARGGRKTWQNIVTACLECNQKKGNKSPEQAGLVLQSRPKAPKWIPGMFGAVHTRRPPRIWEPYLNSEWSSRIFRD